MSLTDDEVAKQSARTLNRLTKWRAHFMGWQLGTRAKGDPEGDAVRDHREVTILLRAELSAMTGLLIEKGVFTAREFTEAVTDEAEKLSQGYSRRWPGCEAGDDGMHYLLPEAAESMRGWLP
jgi:hypothetical protein